MKLKKENIVILSEGAQVERAILEKYDSIDDFITANNFLYMPSTVQKYCNSGVIDSQKFRGNLALAFKKDYHEIVATKAEQIQKYCWHFFKNIYDYNKEDDKEVLEYVTELCRKNEMNLEYALMHRNMGYYYYNVNNMEACAMMFDKSMELLERLRNYNYRMVCLCDLGLIYINQYEYKKALEVFERADKIVDSGFEVERRFLYLYCYRKGVLLRRLKKFKEARLLFEESLKYTEDRHWIGFSLNNIGLTWKSEGNFDKALEFFLSQLVRFNENNEDDRRQRCMLCNNIADLYYGNRQYIEALRYINLAFDSDPKLDMELTFILFFTHVQIKSALEEELSVIDKLTELLSSMGTDVKNKHFISKAIYTVIDIYARTRDEKLFLSISNLIITLIRSTGIDNKKSQYTRELKECLGELHYIKQGGENIV